MPEPWAPAEFAGSDVPDPRYRRVATMIVSCLADKPDESYSSACGPGVRQAARRLLRHDDTTPDGLLHGHYQQTAARCSGRDLVLAIQDTTVFNYSTHKATVGLGPINDDPKFRGLFGHGVLALSTDGEPLGLLHVQMWARDPQRAGQSRDRRKHRTEEKESRKWLQGLAAVQEHLPAQQPVLVVQDREGDVYAFLSTPRRANVHLLVRAAHPRSVILEECEEPSDLLSAASCAPVRGQLTVHVPRKPGQHGREAVLTLRSRTLDVKCPRRVVREGVPKTQTLTVVEAREENPPEEETGIHWVLLTTMSAEREQDCRDLVRYYSLRWTIERLHYVLKSGVRAERLQIDDADALMNALSLFYVVAWHLLQLTYVARTDPGRPASTVLQADEVEALSAAIEKPVNTIAEAVLAIAILGGYEHYRSAPAPGPKRLWIGLRRLEGIVFGWRLAKHRTL